MTNGKYSITAHMHSREEYELVKAIVQLSDVNIKEFARIALLNQVKQQRAQMSTKDRVASVTNGGANDEQTK